MAVRTQSLMRRSSSLTMPVEVPKPRAGVRGTDDWAKPRFFSPQQSTPIEVSTSGSVPLFSLNATAGDQATLQLQQIQDLRVLEPSFRPKTPQPRQLQESRPDDDHILPLEQIPKDIPRSLLALCPSARHEGVVGALTRNAAAQKANEKVMSRVTNAERIVPRLRAVGLLLLLLISLPCSLIGVLIMMMSHGICTLLSTETPEATPAAQQKTAIVTGGHMTKGLHMIRHLHAAGWRVVVTDYPKWNMAMGRFSRGCSHFATVSDPSNDPEGYIRDVAALAAEERADLVVPIAPPNHSILDSLIKELLPKGCRSLALPAAITSDLDDKSRYSHLCARLGLPVPKHWRLTSNQEAVRLNSTPKLLEGKRFILKSILYDPAIRTDMLILPCEPARLDAFLRSVNISESRPFMLQQLMKGPEFSCYALADKGRLVAHADTCAQLSNLNFKHVGRPEIEKFTARICSALKLDGQVCFDFMEDQDDGMMTIECNPRNSTVVADFHDSHDFKKALSSPSEVQETVLPRQDSPEQYWFWNEAWRALTTGSFGPFLKAVGSGSDAVFSPTDPLPFLALHYVQASVLLWRKLVSGDPWNKLDLCIGKLSELGGE
ncbi:hypothetical protein WJX84_000106 [Apatococcus fuscideae]|uniref:ATP-grasp domain-containing protein n=1 Tax=Apatococcus fuscideae TaxID=2026836 RepID=A0AAW1SYK1_9CHLO